MSTEIFMNGGSHDRLRENSDAPLRGSGRTRGGAPPAKCPYGCGKAFRKSPMKNHIRDKHSALMEGGTNG